MSKSCLACLEEHTGEGDHHPRCLKDLFGEPRLPELDVELANVHTLALAMVGRTTLSGVQVKISLGLKVKRATLQLAVGPGRYILKPQTQAFPALPQNEHATMLLASRLGIETPPSGLVRLSDGTLAYLVARFDRPAGGGKLGQEDFCQLAELPPKEKYDGSAELCARLVRRHASEPLIELVKLFRLLVFSWWMGNGDMHLKNFSLLRDPNGLHRLSPAYDQVCTRLVIADDDLALPVGGRKRNLTRRTWMDFARYCEIPEKAATRVLAGFHGAREEALALVSRSLLGEEMKDAYRRLLMERSRTLAGGKGPGRG